MAVKGAFQNPFLKYYEVDSATEIEFLNAVKRDEGDKIVPATDGTSDAGDKIIGIAYAGSESGDTNMVPVVPNRPESRSVGRAGADITVGNDPVPLKTDANADLIVATSSDNIVGYARHSASSGDRIEFDPVVSE